MGLPNPFRETKISGAKGDGEISIFPLQLTTSRIGNLTRLILTLAICDDHTVQYSIVYQMNVSRQNVTIVLILCLRLFLYLTLPSRETIFSGAGGDRGKIVFPVQLTTSRIGNRPSRSMPILCRQPFVFAGNPYGRMRSLGRDGCPRTSATVLILQ